MTKTLRDYQRLYYSLASIETLSNADLTIYKLVTGYCKESFPRSFSSQL